MTTINEVNTALRLLEEEKIQSFSELKYPIIFIVAPPRSGTTLFYQVLSLQYDFFYPTNLLAKFYKAPYIFSKMTKDLDLDRSRVSSSFESYLGNTSGSLEPHEWGWFWERFFVQGESNLVNELAALQSLYAKPMLFKTIYFNYYIETILSLLPNALFLRVERNHVDTIHSIYQAINEKGGPIGCKEHRCCYEKWMDNRVELAVIEYLYDTKILDEKLPAASTIHTHYDDLLEDVSKTSQGVADDIFKLTGNKMVHRGLEIASLLRKTTVENACKEEICKYFDQYSSLSLIDFERILFGKKNER